MKSLSVLIPAFNEGESLRIVTTKVLKALQGTVTDSEIILVNVGSTDETGRIADELAAEFPHVRVIHFPAKKGIGVVFARGIELSTKECFVYVPADNIWPLRSLVALFGNIGKADIITSFTTNPGVRPLSRRLLSQIYTNILNLTFGRHLHYYNGLTIYPHLFLKSQRIKSSGFGFQAELLLGALEAGLSYVELPLSIDESHSKKSRSLISTNLFNFAATFFRCFLKFLCTKATQSKSQDNSAPLSLSTTIRPPGPLKIVVMGASSGIGFALAQSLAQAGHLVFAGGRRATDMTASSETEGRICWFGCDATEENDVNEFAKFVAASTPNIDALVNCVGQLGEIGPIETTDATKWLATLKVNVFAPYLTTRIFLPMLRAGTGAKVLNFSGGGSFNAFPNYSAYATAKTALVRLTECSAAEFAIWGIQVNAIAPGFLGTPVHQATINAGPCKAGEDNYQRAVRKLQTVDPGIEKVVNCVFWFLSPDVTLSGKTISVNFDPWESASFLTHQKEISQSDLYSLRRINLVNMPDGKLKDDLQYAWANLGSTL
jgi:NAD(P)-dependent dehydrogenase (short-subunit alcohol dehydrogenase family)